MPEAGEALLSAGTGAGGSTLLAAAVGGGTGGRGGIPADEGEDAARLLRLAAGQRMNTDARRAVFVALMGAADVVDAHERLLRLPLKVGGHVLGCMEGGRRVAQLTSCTVTWSFGWVSIIVCRSIVCISTMTPAGRAGARDCACGGGLLLARGGVQPILRAGHLAPGSTQQGKRVKGGTAILELQCA